VGTVLDKLKGTNTTDGVDYYQVQLCATRCQHPSHTNGPTTARADGRPVRPRPGYVIFSFL
jgi:hypothetical protein